MLDLGYAQTPQRVALVKAMNEYCGTKEQLQELRTLVRAWMYTFPRVTQ